MCEGEGGSGDGCLWLGVGDVCVGVCLCLKWGQLQFLQSHGIVLGLYFSEPPRYI